MNLINNSIHNHIYIYIPGISGATHLIPAELKYVTIDRKSSPLPTSPSNMTTVGAPCPNSLSNTFTSTGSLLFPFLRRHCTTILLGCHVSFLLTFCDPAPNRSSEDFGLFSLHVRRTELEATAQNLRPNDAPPTTIRHLPLSSNNPDRIHTLLNSILHSLNVTSNCALLHRSRKNLYKQRECEVAVVTNGVPSGNGG